MTIKKGRENRLQKYNSYALKSKMRGILYVYIGINLNR